MGYWSLGSRSALTRTSPISLSLSALHVFLPIFPWFAIDLGAIVALAALSGCTDRYLLLYTSKAPFGSGNGAESPRSAPMEPDRVFGY